MRMPLALLMLAAFAAPLSAQEADKTPAPKPAKVDAAKAPEGSPWKKGMRFKIALDETTDAHFRLSGQIRMRMQEQTPTTYTPGAGNQKASFDTFLRTRLGLEMRIAPWANAMIEMQDSRRFGEDANGGSDGTNGFDLLQGNIFAKDEIFGWDSTLRLGRQRFTLGEQRLISTLEFSNTPRTWDGFTVDATSGDHRVRKFWLMLEDGGKPDQDDHLFGLSYQRTFKDNDSNHELEGALIYQLRQGVVKDRVLTASLREKGKSGDFDFKGEGIFQYGVEEAAPQDRDVQAYALALELGYTLESTGFGEVDLGNVRLALSYDLASGDSDATDDKSETFRSPFPFGHKFQGIADVVGWRNVHDIALHVSMTKKYDDAILGDSGTSQFKLAAQYHYFKRVESEDDVYRHNNAAYGRGGITADHSDSIGSEIDLQANVKLNNWLSLEAAWAHFFAGDFFKDSKAPGAGDGGNEDGDRDFFWVAITLKF